MGLGYSHVPRVDHKDNFLSVVSDTTFRYVMVLALMNNWEMEVVDIKTAFLYGILEEEIFMKIPEGLDVYKGCEYWIKQYMGLSKQRGNSTEDCQKQWKMIWVLINTWLMSVF